MEKGLMFWRSTGRSALPRFLAALFLLSFAIVLLGFGGIFNRLSAQSTAIEEPALKLATPIRPDTMRMEWTTLQIPANDFQPIKSDTSTGSFTIPLGPSTPRASPPPTAGSFTETYDNGSDVGKWVASFNVPRQIQPTGGSSLAAGIPAGSYLQQGGFSSSIPTWGTASPRYQPGFNDEFKEDSVFVGNWTGAGVQTFGVDLEVIQSGNWPAPGRPVTLQLMQMDSTGFGVNYVASYTTPILPAPPLTWAHFDFPINANSGAVPSGWVFTHGDGSPGNDSEWATFLSRVDLTSVGFYAPGFAYPGTGSWTLGIDNISVQYGTKTTEPRFLVSPAPAPEPTSLAFIGVVSAGLFFRRRRRRH